MIDLIRGVVFSDSSDARLVLATPAANVAVLLLMFTVFMIAGTALFVRRETNR